MTIRDGVRSELEILIKDFSAPLLIADGRLGRSMTMVNGTAFFWRSLDGCLIVTAGHVGKAVYDTLRRKGPKAACVGIAGRPLSLAGSKMIITEDEGLDLDLAIFKAPGIESIDLGDKRFFRSTIWPLAGAVDDELVGLIGFPGKLRTKESSGNGRVRVVTESIYIEKYASMARSGRALALTTPGEAEIVLHSRRAQIVEDVGGISGAPVFALRNGAPHWVGIVKEGASAQTLTSTIMATPADWIMGDGLVRPASRHVINL